MPCKISYIVCLNAVPSPVCPKRPLNLIRLGLLSRALELPSRGDVEHGVGDGEQDPAAMLPDEPNYAHGVFVVGR